MKPKILKLIKIDTWRSLPAVLRELLKDEASGGKLTLAAAALALIVANTPLRSTYDSLWAQVLSISVANQGISLDLRHWVSEGLMAIFFLVVGLEIKREVVKGQLHYFKTAALPIGAAIGGMIIPAALFIAISTNHPDIVRGWAIPTATDIAFALAVISLLGNRVSSALKLFLLTLAIVDDIGSIAVITLFYGNHISLMPTVAAAVVALSIVLLSQYRRMSVPLFVMLGLLFWYAIFKSGIHASIAGALLGFLAPISAKGNLSVAEKLEAYLIPVATFFVVPMFAFASLGIPITHTVFDSNSSVALGWGIFAGFVLGKVLGVSLTAWVLIKLRLSELPHDTNWFQLIGVGFLAGIGFTVSVFIADIAFATSPDLVNAAKVSILIASVVSALGGYMFLRHRKSVEKMLLQDL